GIEQATVRRIQSGLAERAYCRRARREVAEAHRRRCPQARSVLEAHPRFGDHAEDAFGAEEQPIRARSRARSGESARGDDAGGGHHTQQFHEYVDGGVKRREVAAGTGRDPPAERAELERLREVAERETVRPEALLERGTEDSGLDARGARRAIDLE